MSSLSIREREEAHDTTHSMPDHDTTPLSLPGEENASSSEFSSLTHNDANAPPTLLHSSSPSHDALDEDEDDFSDHFDYSPPSPLISSPDPSDPSSDDSDSPSTTTNESLTQHLLPLPTSSPGNLTHAHQQVMANRITFDKLDPDGAFDTAKYTPVFLHDTLMLPGSLASLLGKVRTARLIVSFGRIVMLYD